MFISETFMFNLETELISAGLILGYADDICSIIGECAQLFQKTTSKYRIQPGDGKGRTTAVFRSVIEKKIRNIKPGDLQETDEYQSLEPHLTLPG